MNNLKNKIQSDNIKSKLHLHTINDFTLDIKIQILKEAITQIPTHFGLCSCMYNTVRKLYSLPFKYWNDVSFYENIFPELKEHSSFLQKYNPNYKNLYWWQRGSPTRLRVLQDLLKQYQLKL